MTVDWIFIKEPDIKTWTNKYFVKTKLNPN